MAEDSKNGAEAAADVEVGDSLANLDRRLAVLASVRELLARLAAKMEEGGAGKSSK